MEPFERLQLAREKAGYPDASDAARAFDWKIPTYISHENGTRGLRKDTAERYAKALRTTPEWLLYERGKPPKGVEQQRPAAQIRQRTVDLVGYVGAGAIAHFTDPGTLGEVAAPDGLATDTTVAVEVRGDSLGALFDRWLVFYDDVKRPVTSDQIGRLCVVGLEDGRILIKKIQKARGRPNTYHLLSNTEAPILDVEIEWAARVKSMVPR